MITVGASEAVDASLRAMLIPGDEVIYHEPCFVAYAPCIELAGGVPVPVIATGDATDFQVTAGARSRRPSRPAPRRSSSATPTTRPARCWTAASWRPSPRSPSAMTCWSSATRSTTGSSMAAHRARRFRLAGRHAGADGADRRLQQGLCHDGLAHRLRGRPRGADGRHRQGAPVRDHVRADPRAVRRHRGAAHRRAVRDRDARRIRPPASADDPPLQRDGPATASSRGARSTASRTSPRPGWTTRPSPSSSWPRSRSAVVPGRRSVRRARATCARATRPPTRRSSRRWTASSGSSLIAGAASRLRLRSWAR